MSPEVTISKWGNSQGVRIPKEIIESFNVHIGDKMKVSIENNRLILEPVKVGKKFNISELVNQIPNNYKKEKEYFSAPMGREVL